MLLRRVDLRVFDWGVAMKLLVGVCLVTLLNACASGGGGGGGVAGNDNGSAPVNEQESYEYQRAVNRCHRTGGTRVVKVQGELRCY